MAESQNQQTGDVTEAQGPDATAYLVTYYAILSLLLIGSFLPQLRVWGINVWSHQPLALPLICFGAGAVLPLVLRPFQARWRPESTGPSNSVVWLATGGLSVGLVALYYFLRARSFYLGDGYTVLSLLSEEVPLVKKRDLGEALIHVWVKHLSGREGEAGSLFAFQAISIGAGMVALALLIWSSRKLFDRGWQRLAFPLLTLSSGFSLLYFGYVENYSVFVTSVLAFGLVGLLVAEERISRWWVILPAGIAMFMHVFGAALIPALIYILISNTPLGDRISEMNVKTKVLILFLILVGIAAAFFHYYFKIYYFRFSLVPLVPDRFTIDGYWLLSIMHLVDTLNLLQMLLPGLALTIILFIKSGPRLLLGGRDYRFLMIFFVGALGEIFLFDPKLGMARDWDLFSLVGVPLALTAAWLVLDLKTTKTPRLLLIGMVAGLGFLVLIPRALSQTDRETGFAWFESYTELDLTKSMYARSLIHDYYEERNDSTGMNAAIRQYVEDYPCWVANREGLIHKKAGDCQKAIPYFERAIQLHPLYAAAYTNLGVCLRGQGRFDSSLALLEIAAALNPYNATIAKEMGAVQFLMGDLMEAEMSLLQALAIDPNNTDALIGLVQLYREQKKTDQYLEFLQRLVQHPDAPMPAFKELAEYYVTQKDWGRAGALYKRAIQMGLDTAYVRILREQAPQLGL